MRSAPTDGGERAASAIAGTAAGACSSTPSTCSTRAANQIEYFYESQLRGEPAPVADRHVHPIEPLAVRLTLAGPLP